MKYLIAGVSAAALLSFGAAAGAQTYPSVWGPGPAPIYAPSAPPASPPTWHSAALWPEMMDDGSSSDFPTHTPSDFVANRLNRQVMIGNGDEAPAVPYGLR